VSVSLVSLRFSHELESICRRTKRGKVRKKKAKKGRFLKSHSELSCGRGYNKLTILKLSRFLNSRLNDLKNESPIITIFIEPFNRGIYVSLILFLPELPTCRCRQFVESNDDVLHLLIKHYAYKKGYVEGSSARLPRNGSKTPRSYKYSDNQLDGGILQGRDRRYTYVETCDVRELAAISCSLVYLNLVGLQRFLPLSTQKYRIPLLCYYTATS
jgi:hypothetical protein